ncbi:MAG TPA: acetyl-CoA carboxylase biotin carboxyl carrier protein [Candidatus Omnitrophota bacterium]|nr:acetyl-CoA carboxylase biotin carboxyl carrier protein [Candidatus Omnitrophota bacterium]HPB67501.1 acetyl-CoA carboxylase biotin carboxyl carrier protein [Candidatus Omnitrophota bacterium]HQO57510.1 acetyl-CoA carboxylase biotin carboxyl carrier protein [Candidatus Omnitrophota bacterium]
MNLKDIKAIVELMNENELTEIEVEREGEKLKIKKAALETGGPVIRPAVEYRMPVAPSAPPPAEAGSAGAKAQSNLKIISSPMVGTFYRAPSPESPPFVEQGQTVEIGQVVCIVEAMKLMNEIKSEVRGKIVKIAVDNAEPVEFGQTLFEIESV